MALYLSSLNPNLLNLVAQMQAKGSKQQSSQDNSKFKVKRENENPQMANLLAALTGVASPDDKPTRGKCIWVTGLPESFQDADKLVYVFGNFGNVRKVVYSDKTDAALIELDDSR